MPKITAGFLSKQLPKLALKADCSFLQQAQGPPPGTLSVQDLRYVSLKQLPKPALESGCSFLQRAQSPLPGTGSAQGFHSVSLKQLPKPAPKLVELVKKGLKKPDRLLTVGSG